MTHVTCRLTAKNRDLLRNPTLVNQVWATFLLLLFIGSSSSQPAYLRSSLHALGLRQTIHTHCASVHEAAKLVSVLLRVARVTAGMAGSNGSLALGLWLTGWLPRTGISSGTLRSAVEHGLPVVWMYVDWVRGSSSWSCPTPRHPVAPSGDCCGWCIVAASPWRRVTSPRGHVTRAVTSRRRTAAAWAWTNVVTGWLVCVHTYELYILWSELSRRQLSPTSTTAHYSCPDNTIGLVAQYELSRYVKLG